MNKFVELKICNYIDDTLDVEREVKFKENLRHLK